MTQEEKAKAYDEVLERAQKATRAGSDVAMDIIQYIFPNINDSEDERIRKALIWHLKAGEDFVSNGVTKEQTIAWLEKQKPSFKQISDSVIWDSGLRTGIELGKQKEQDKCPEYCVRSHCIGCSIYEKQKEQKHTLKFKVGDKVHLEGDNINILTITGIGEDRYLTDCAYGPILFGAEDIWQIVEQKHYWKPTETDVALFNKAVTTNKALTPSERAQLDIIRSKFGCCRATNCSGIVQEERKDFNKLYEDIAKSEWFQKSYNGKSLGCDDAQEPITEVFGFKVGDAVRLKDGDGRKHIIKAFEEIEGIHGPNFYHVEFEDNSARDGIYPGKEYPNGYYTQMEKFEEEPGKDKDFSDCLTELACELYECHDESDTPEDTSIKEYHVLEKWEPILLKKAQQQEWNDEDNEMRLEAIRVLESGCERYRKESGCLPSWHKVINWLKSIPLNLKKKNEDVAKLCSNEWSEEDEKIAKEIEEELWYPGDFPDYPSKEESELYDDCQRRLDWFKSKLKSIRSFRPSWKPREEQMYALQDAIIFMAIHNMKVDSLVSLHKELKKLM